jgi:hypothetical protein
VAAEAAAATPTSYPEVEEPAPADAASDPPWIQVAASAASFSDVGASPAPDYADASAGGAPDLEASKRIDLIFDKFSEMATESIKKLTNILSNRGGDTSDSGSVSEGSEQSGDLPAESGGLSAPVGAIVKVVRERPELGVIATFAGGLILATLLKRLARR